MSCSWKGRGQRKGKRLASPSLPPPENYFLSIATTFAQDEFNSLAYTLYQTPLTSPLPASPYNPGTTTSLPLLHPTTSYSSPPRPILHPSTTTPLTLASSYTPATATPLLRLTLYPPTVTLLTLASPYTPYDHIPPPIPLSPYPPALPPPSQKFHQNKSRDKGVERYETPYRQMICLTISPGLPNVLMLLVLSLLLFLIVSRPGAPPLGLRWEGGNVTQPYLQLETLSL